MPAAPWASGAAPRGIGDGIASIEQVDIEVIRFSDYVPVLG